MKLQYISKHFKFEPPNFSVLKNPTQQNLSLTQSIQILPDRSINTYNLPETNSKRPWK